MPNPEPKAAPFESNLPAWRVAATVALVSGLFVLVVAVLLIANYLQIEAIAPLDNPELLALRKQLKDAPEPNEQLVQEIRAMDLLARKAFFTSQTHLRMGGQLLLAGAVLFLVSFRLAARWRPAQPAPDDGPANYWEIAVAAKEYIATGGIALTALALSAAYFTPSEVPQPPAAAGPGEAATEQAVAADAAPTWEEMQLQWPSFRGPGAYGVAHFTTAPTQWDLASGHNIRWKTELALPGNNSPVVWGNRVYLCGATADAREVYCYDTETGQQVWKHTLEKFPGTPEKSPKIDEETSYAPPTMIAQGKRVAAMFPNGDIVCLDSDGKLLWGKNLGVPDNHYGHASSLLALDNLVYVQFDDKAKPRLMALELATGNEAWTAARTKISWSSPACVPTDFGMQLVLNSERDVDAYDPKSGKPLWKVECLDGEVAPSPAYFGNMVFVGNEYAKSAAIVIEKDGESVKATEKWVYEDVLPETSSPLASAAHFYIATARGEVVCLDRETGQAAWTHEFDEGYDSSPILVGDRIYLADKEGLFHIFKAGAQFEAIADIAMGEPVHATPAYLDGRIYIRTQKQLVCVEKKE